jgi:alanine-glyoxylate transaminase/(R)-3-amino-2-methylpropionate-pyruvate transaminase
MLGKAIKVVRRGGSSMPGFGYQPGGFAGLAYESAKQYRAAHMFDSCEHLYKEPLYITEGRMQYLFDHKGKRYLDMVGGSGCITVGHCHPRVTEAIHRQTEKVNHISSVFVNDFHALYSEALAKRCPEGLDQVFLTNSGTEANELTLNMIRQFTRKPKVFALRQANHGHVSGLTNLSSWNHAAQGGYGIEKLPFPSQYRGNYQGANQGAFHLRELKETITAVAKNSIAGMIAEPIMGAAGVHPLPASYLAGAYQLIREEKGLCVSDEAHTGFGRTG